MIISDKLTSVISTMKHPLPLTLMLLNDWSFVTVTGIDANKYLQSKVTADISILTPQQHVFTAHCNAEGKIWSTLHLFHYKKGFGYILRSSVLEKQLSEFKKYAVFSQITFKKQSDVVLLGIAGKNARNTLSKYFSQLPNQEKSVVHFEKTTLLNFNIPYERFLIITDSNTSNYIMKNFSQYSNSQQWLSLDIAAGIANIDIENTELFTPQDINLQALPNSISFKKGCYSGQERIARVKYRGTNKRSMYWLYGMANTLPKPGEAIEWKIGNNWRNTGIILAAVNLLNGFISVQIVMNSNIHKDSVFRVLGETDSQLTIQQLPY